MGSETEIIIDFIEYIKQYDIVILGETWIQKNDLTNLDIEGYYSDHVFASKSLGTTKGRYSGGITVYVKNRLKDHVTIAEKNDYGLLWIKLSKTILKYDIDTYIGYLYAREKYSRIFRHEDVDYYELLETDIVKYQLLGKVLVTGDFNGRTGSGSDFILYDRYIEAGLDESIRLTDIPVRCN